ncbi:MAG: cobyric acid synthase [Deltaproteobacteria bacterium]|nr:MAG: cobyric acid synthase [Deltaproteobacteria bacterium]
MTRWVIFNKKGGVGKTTLTCNLAAISAVSGNKTLVVDLDPQANASQYLMGDSYGAAKDGGKTVYDYFKTFLSGSSSAFTFNPFLPQINRPKADIADHVHPTRFDNFFVLPAHPALTVIETQLAAKHKIYKLKEALDALKAFDAVFIDTPPALNFYSQSALIAASRCLIPFDCDAFSRDAVFEVGNHIADIQGDHNPDLRVEGIVVNQFLPRANHPREMIERLEADGLPLMQTRLSASVKIKESHQVAMPMIYLDPRHKLTSAFQSLYHEISGID